MYERCKGQRDSCFATISRVCGLDWTPNNSSKLWWAAMCRCSGGAAWLPRTLVEGRGQRRLVHAAPRHTHWDISMEICLIRPIGGLSQQAEDTWEKLKQGKLKH